MQKNKLPNIVSILILTLITVVMWVSFNIYRAVTEKPAPAVPKTISDSISPKLDTDTINKIESSVFMDSSQIPQNVVKPSPTASVSASPIPTQIP